MNNKVKIIIDPACNFYYSSFYIKGLIELFENKIRFSSKPFRNLKYDSTTHFLAFTVAEGNKQKKIIIDFADAPEINNSFLSWSDVYGKVNYRKPFASINSKVIPIAPNFAVKIWSKPIAGIFGILNYIKSQGRTISFYNFLSKYLMSANRFSDFGSPPFIIREDYIFFASTFWETQTQTNMLRATFIRACRSAESVLFEGGLIPESDKINQEYSDVMLSETYSYIQYINKIKNSLLVFNTPAYHLCHGWKLAEYLAMGKAIISTPFANELPVPLEHGKNIYFVSGDSKEMEDSILRLRMDHELRRKLESGAYDYYLKYVQPINSIKHLLNIE